jgi:hypothetical protein
MGWGSVNDINSMGVGSPESLGRDRETEIGKRSAGMAFDKHGRE